MESESRGLEVMPDHARVTGIQVMFLRSTCDKTTNGIHSLPEGPQEGSLRADASPNYEMRPGFQQTRADSLGRQSEILGILRCWRRSVSDELRWDRN